MKKIYRIIFLLIFNSVFSIHNSFSQNPFQRIISGLGVNQSNSAQITSDKGLIMATQGGLVKTDSLGVFQWAKHYNSFWFYTVKQTPDNGYVVTGMTINGNLQDFLLIKTDSIGDTLWTKAYGGPLTDWPYALELTPDSGYILGGYTKSFGSANGAIYLIKVNSSGDTLWTRTFGEGSVGSIKRTNDNNFIVTGWCSVPGNSSDVFLIKINPNGDTLWTRTYGSGNDETAREVIQTSDNGFAVIGTTFSYPNAGDDDIFFLRTDSLGYFPIAKAYGNVYVDEGAGLKQTSDGGFILAGRMQGMGGGGGNCGAIGWCYDAYLIRINAVGDTLWTRTYGGNDYDWAYSVDITNDQGFIITGETGSYNPIPSIYIIKSDSAGNSFCNQYNTNTVVNNQIPTIHSGLPIGAGGNIYPTNVIVTSLPFSIDSSLCNSTGIMETVSNSEVKFSPNPLTTQSKLTFKNPNKEKFLYTLYDITGRVTESVSTTNNEIILTKGSKPAGVYLFNLMNEKTGERWNGKIVINN